MTKKLQPTRSVRSLLFGGPHLDFTITVPMEECIRRLQHLEKVGRLWTYAPYAFDSLEINDFGRTVRWSFATESITATGSIMRIPVKGSFTLQGEQQVRVRAVVGSGVRVITYWILFLSYLTVLTAFPILGLMVVNNIFLRPLEWPWAALPDLAMIGILSAWVFIILVISPIVARRIPKLTNPIQIETIAFSLENGLLYPPSTPDSEPAEPAVRRAAGQGTVIGRTNTESGES